MGRGICVGLIVLYMQTVTTNRERGWWGGEIKAVRIQPKGEV